MDNRQSDDEDAGSESTEIYSEPEDAENAFQGTKEDSDTNDSNWKPEEADEIDTGGSFGLDSCRTSRFQHSIKEENEFTEETEKQEVPDGSEEDEGDGGGKKRRGKKRKGKQSRKSDPSSFTQADQPIKTEKRRKKDDLKRSTSNDENSVKIGERSKNDSIDDPNKTYYCFHKRCMEAFGSFAELKAHCADDHNYTGSLRCGRCHNVYGDEEIYETHKAVCTAKLQCIDCGRTFPERKEFTAHVELPCCDRQTDYKLLYHQTSKIISYSFSKSAENKILTKTRLQRKLESSNPAAGEEAVLKDAEEGDEL